MRAQFAEAEDLLQQTLSLSEQVLEPEHPGLANLLSNLALVYAQQEKMKEAEGAALRAISLWEQASGHECFSLIEPLMTLSWLCSTQNRQEEAEVLFQRATCVWEQNWPAHQSEILLLLDDVIPLYRKHPQNAQVEKFSRRTFALRSQAEEEEQTKILYS
jgi:tetratricopeptide (TPR) repeat protein